MEAFLTDHQSALRAALLGCSSHDGGVSKAALMHLKSNRLQ